MTIPTVNYVCIGTFLYSDAIGGFSCNLISNSELLGVGPGV